MQAPVLALLRSQAGPGRPLSALCCSCDGAVMLGRLLDQYLWVDPEVDPTYVWGDVAPLLTETDLRTRHLRFDIELLAERLVTYSSQLVRFCSAMDCEPRGVAP